MYRKMVMELFCSEGDIHVTKILRQHWRQSRYSYLEVPRPDHGLMLLLRGSIDFVTQNGKISAVAGNLIYLPKGCLYEANFLCRAEDYLLSFECREDNLRFSEPVILFENAPSQCVECFRALVDEKYSESHRALKSRGLFYLLLDSIANEAEDSKSRQPLWIGRAKELLQKNENIPFGDIAKECAVSESGFRQIFKETVGMTPVQYRLDFRLSQAVYLLEATDMSVNEIAESLSFFDAAYFCRVFRNRMGMSPKQYIKNKQL